jgi:mono/diheme cytochrome c family protein
MPGTISALPIVLVFLLLSLNSTGETRHQAAQTPSKNGPRLNWRTTRSSPLDLEVSGNLIGLAPGAKRYVRRIDLLTLPRVNLPVTGDPNFARAVKVSGVELNRLVRELAADGQEATIVAVCKDFYRSYYPREYRDIHKPVLALEIDGQPPTDWPRTREGSGMSLGPYLITHESFTPAFKILAHEDEAQIPWGVARLEFKGEKSAYRAIEPRGPKANDAAARDGYRIAQQNCYRCHGPASDEPLKGKLTWDGVAAFAAQAPKDFAAYVRDPQAISKDARMPPNPNYDDATLQALTAYFKSFAATETR